ncbi:MAG: hypothetical protein AB8I08_16885 [Sandaracinaceae bacterium]
MAWTRISVALATLSLLLGGCHYHIYDGDRDGDDDCWGWHCDDDEDDDIDEDVDEDVDEMPGDAAPLSDGGVVGGGETCVDDLECGPGCRCDDGACIVSGCSEDSECESEAVCLEGQCVATEDTCQFDSACGAGRGCIDQACRLFCGEDADCVAGERCSAGRCSPSTDECMDNAQCDDAEVCFETRCLQTCDDETDCGPDAHCEARLCRPDVAPRPFCEDDEGCAPGSLCVGGVCRSPCPTGTDEECLRWDSQLVECVEASAEPALLLCITANESRPECAGAADCLGGQRCVDAICRNR